MFGWFRDKSSSRVVDGKEVTEEELDILLGLCRCSDAVSVPNLAVQLSNKIADSALHGHLNTLASKGLVIVERVRVSIPGFIDVRKGYTLYKSTRDSLNQMRQN
ncbi:hypothetical protein H6784_03470 [Candidatus Nomurabacteria bacterium]|nr:hypothetical protein [Candidatus Kaiserbacteria bacterium]MCB9811113.1 hypothetical protein [Candidatus Nomurabacteria bacterium]MCB9814451.1 hypothetical protein [Candidatus Nomurabacteria bacterium]